jgi:hypothetical protein
LQSEANIGKRLLGSRQPEFDKKNPRLAGQFLKSRGNLLVCIFSGNFICNTASHDAPDFGAEENFQRNLESLAIFIIRKGRRVAGVNRSGGA